MAGLCNECQDNRQVNSDLLGCHTACSAGDKITYNWNMVKSAIPQCKQQSATLHVTDVHVLKQVLLV